MFTPTTPETCEAFDVEFAEEQAQRAVLAAEAAELTWAEMLADLRRMGQRLDEMEVSFTAMGLATSPPLGPDFALTEDELEAVSAQEAAYWQAQDARESYGDFIAARAAELETDEEPSGYDPSDEQLCRVR